LNKENFIEEDEIDLKELFRTVWVKRKFIFSFTFFVSLISIIYVLFKNPIPLYEGNVLVEIGEIQSENFSSQPFDNPNNLSEILKIELGLKSFLPKGTNQLLIIISKNRDKDVINKDLKKAVEFIIERHKEKASFYKNFIMTKQIGDINISNKSINKMNKKLIVIISFFTSFILSIFIVFFIKFIKGSKSE